MAFAHVLTDSWHVIEHRRTSTEGDGVAHQHGEHVERGRRQWCACAEGWRHRDRAGQ